MGLNQFMSEIENHKKDVERQGELIFKKVCIDAYSNIVRRTPFDTGRAAGGWMLDVNAAPTGEPPRGANQTAKLARLRLTDTAHITNNVEYIEYLENGSSKQAPHGMVAVTLEETKQAFG